MVAVNIVIDILIVGLGLCAAFNQYGLFMALPIWGIAGITTLPILTNQFKGAIQYISLAAIGLIYFG